MMADLFSTKAMIEFSRPLEISELEQGELVRDLAAEAGELAALQKRYGVEALHSASAHLTISPETHGAVKVSGVVSAELDQICIISLEPVAETIDEPICVTYLPPGVNEPSDELETDEEFEAFDGISIDLGELTSQQIAAAIDPYPRRSGVIFGNQGQLGDNEPEERDNPFAVLQKLKGEGRQE